jgi:hypothetical protein
MGTDDKKLTWLDKDKKISFSVKDCTISSSALDSLKEGEIYYESTAGESYIGTTTGYKPIKIHYDDYPIAKTITKTTTKEQEQIETLIRAVTNLIKEVEELKKDNAFQYDKILVLEAENGTLRDSMEEMYVEMVAIKEKTMILESRKADKEPATIETSTLASCC